MNNHLLLKFGSLLILAGMVLLVASCTPIPNPAQINATDVEARPPLANIANPAAVYCRDLGYKYRILDGPDGQSGECIFPDSACNDWDFLSGQCGQQYSYCARLGYQTITMKDGINPFSPEYALCVSPDGKTSTPATELFDMDQKIVQTGCVQDEVLEEEDGASEPGPLPEEPVEAQQPSAPAAPLAAFDWTNYGGNWLPPIRNQGGCGSCWAFSAVGVTEAAHNIAANNPNLDLDLSEQYLVANCNTYDGTCCGGYNSTALNNIKNYGIPDEGCMPYVDGGGCSCSGSCSTNCTYNISSQCSDRTCNDRCSDWDSRLKFLSQSGKILPVDAVTIKQRLQSDGPLSVLMGIGSSYGGAFEGSTGSIYRCTNDTGINHAVIIVGYDDAGGYWLVRNSWGSSWDGDGYFKVGFGECSIENYVYYAKANPIVMVLQNPIFLPIIRR